MSHWFPLNYFIRTDQTSLLHMSKGWLALNIDLHYWVKEINSCRKTEQALLSTNYSGKFWILIKVYAGQSSLCLSWAWFREHDDDEHRPSVLPKMASSSSSSMEIQLSTVSEGPRSDVGEFTNSSSRSPGTWRKKRHQMCLISQDIGRRLWYGQQP